MSSGSTGTPRGVAAGAGLAEQALLGASAARARRGGFSARAAGGWNGLSTSPAGPTTSWVIFCSVRSSS